MSWLNSVQAQRSKVASFSRYPRGEKSETRYDTCATYEIAWLEFRHSRWSSRSRPVCFETNKTLHSKASEQTSKRTRSLARSLARALALTDRTVTRPAPSVDGRALDFRVFTRARSRARALARRGCRRCEKRNQPRRAGTRSRFSCAVGRATTDRRTVR